MWYWMNSLDDLLCTIGSGHLIQQAALMGAVSETWQAYMRGVYALFLN